MNEVHQAMLAHMQKLQGRDFEKAFVYGQVADHVKDILCFRDAASEVQDPQLKQFATASLPKLQEHLREAQRLAGWGAGADAQPAGARRARHRRRRHERVGRFRHVRLRRDGLGHERQRRVRHLGLGHERLRYERFGHVRLGHRFGDVRVGRGRDVGARRRRGRRGRLGHQR